MHKSVAFLLVKFWISGGLIIVYSGWTKTYRLVFAEKLKWAWRIWTFNGFEQIKNQPIKLNNWTDK